MIQALNANKRMLLAMLITLIVGFEDQAIERGQELSGWSWNAKFADVDNDGWKDIYISSGFFQSDTRKSNFFYLNNKDGQADTVEINLPNGEKNVLKGPFLAGARYVVTRGS